MVEQRRRSIVALDLLLYSKRARKFLRKQEKKNGNVIVINEACQLCGSMALQMSCYECGLLLCQECIEYLNGKSVCSCCLQALQNPRHLATELMFPTGVSQQACPCCGCDWRREAG
jgi:hypothetical protein